jgi:hypothetical protein
MPVDAAHLPSTADPRPDSWTERAGDWFNPILVKEVRQALKSRQFVLTFLLLLVGAWLVSFLSVMWLDVEFGQAGPRVFWWYYLVLAVAMFVIVPFTAFRSLLAERDDNTLDLLSITTLSPRQVVRGKLLSALVQLFIFYSAVAPFVAFSSMLKGFSAPEVLYVLVLSLLVSVLVCVFALMISTLAKQRIWQMLLAFALLAGLVFLFVNFALVPYNFGTELGIAGMLVGTTQEWDDADFWWGNAVGLCVGLSYAVLFGRIAVARLTFESDNRSTAIRIVCFLQFVLVWACLYSEMGAVLVTLSLIHFGFVGLFAATEPEELSRRIRRDLPRNGLLRFLVTPWMPGGGRGYLYVLGCLFTLWWLVIVCIEIGGMGTIFESVDAVFDHDATSDGELVQFVTAGCCYVTIYTGIGCLLLRLLLPLSGEIKSSHVRIVTILVALVGIIVPYLIQATISNVFRDYSLLLITVPFDTLSEIHRGREFANVATWILLIAAALVVCANLPALVRGFGELWDANPEYLQLVDAARHGEAKDQGSTSNVQRTTPATSHRSRSHDDSPLTTDH